MQTFCATSIVSIASEEFKSSITFWATVPYAVSLATSVAYKSLRNSSIPYKRKRAYALFHSSCDILDELSKGFLSARVMARLAMDTLQEVERVAVGRKEARSQQRSGQFVNERNGTFQLSEPLPDALPASISRSEEGLNSLQTSQSMEMPSPYSTTLEAALLALNPNNFNDYVGDAGIFSDFDPSFDLNRIDAVFSANLDPTLPLVPEEWMNDNQFI